MLTLPSVLFWNSDVAFRWCVDVCASGAGCVMMPPEMRHPHTGCVAACPAQIDTRPPLGVRALRWSCRDDCKCAAIGFIQTVDVLIVVAGLSCTQQPLVKRRLCDLDMTPQTFGRTSPAVAP